MITYRLHLICPAEAPDTIAQLAKAAEEGLYPRPAKVYYAPLKSCKQTSEVLYPNLLMQRADFLLPFSQHKQDAVHAVKVMLQEMMGIGFTEAAVVADNGVLAQILTACALPEQPVEEWRLQPGKGYTLLTDAALWMRCEKLELYDTVPSSAVSDYADDEAYLDYAESLLDEGTV